ncbi:MAG: hypothetical protein OXF02_07935 [Simkaniaceae bacterium]|nr:hypothetical protein [Simkaniaceae bacterium]
MAVAEPGAVVPSGAPGFSPGACAPLRDDFPIVRTARNVARSFCLSVVVPSLLTGCSLFLLALTDAPPGPDVARCFAVSVLTLSPFIGYSVLLAMLIDRSTSRSEICKILMVGSVVAVPLVTLWIRFLIGAGIYATIERPEQTFFPAFGYSSGQAGWSPVHSPACAMSIGSSIG